jgi:hypothetical protein
MSSQYDFEGTYSNTMRFMFNNWSTEDFTQHFGEENSYNDNKVVTNQPAYDLTIKAGEMRELGQFQAHICVRHFVNREMLRESNLLTGKDKERIEMGMGHAQLRKPYEDKTISEIKPGEESPFMDKLRAEIRAEEIAKMTSSNVNVPIESLTKAKEEEVIAKIKAGMSTESKKKAGRPAKVQEFSETI